MQDSQKDFDAAWKKLTSQGEMCGPAPKPFTPVGIRKDVQEAGPLYHGTKAALKPGDFLKPGFPSNYGAHRIANFVYVTAILGWGGIGSPIGPRGGTRPGVYCGAYRPHRGRPQCNGSKVSGEPLPLLPHPISFAGGWRGFRLENPSAGSPRKDPQAYGSGRCARDRSHQRMIRFRPLLRAGLVQALGYRRTPHQRACERFFAVATYCCAVATVFWLQVSLLGGILPEKGGRKHDLWRKNPAA